MPLPTPTFVAGLLLLLYLLSFIVFAFIRVVTGVSIQRIGFSGLRRIAFTPKDGIRIEVRGIGFTVHRPTFAQPTWLSLYLTEVKVTVDVKRLREKPRKKKAWAHWGNTKSGKSTPEVVVEEDEQEDCEEEEPPRSRTWERLTNAKEKIKRLHRKVKWIRLVDLIASSTTLVVKDVGSLQVGSFYMNVDTRRKTVDRSRLFNHHKPSPNKEQRPAEWLFTLRSVLFTPEGKDSIEILDHCTLNVHGMLYKELDGLRDASIALKLGRLSIPYDDVKICLDRAKDCTATSPRPGHTRSQSHVSFDDLLDELDHSGSREESIIRTVSDSKEFASSILRGIQEFQFAVSFLGVTKQIQTSNDSNPAIYLNISMKEVGMDLLRLDPRSPAHLMYFSPNDIAHQGSSQPFPSP